MATRVTSFSSGFRSAPYSTILYSAPGCTQCATVSTRVGAIRLPVQKLPREPTMVTTERPTPSVEGAAPPTIAAAGGENSSASAALMTAGIFIGAGIARRAENAKRCAGWHRSTRRVSRFGGDVLENRGHDGRGGDLGFRRGAHHVAVRGVCTVRALARTARRHHPPH